MLSIAEIKKRLASTLTITQPPESPYPIDFFVSAPNPAAVLVPFIEKENSWHLLYIRRTVVSHDRHSGQVAFPGGRAEISDRNAEDTAIREANEEIGIDPANIQILGRLRDMLTITNYRVTPVVCVLPWPFEFCPQENEVARIFSIPLMWLADSTNRSVKMRGTQVLDEPVPVIYFHKFDGEVLWGASARITLLLLEALGFSVPGNRYNQQG
jgi:8-oxo-dGTP pyrophosphatase MutT (NUDIX family)